MSYSFEVSSHLVDMGPTEDGERYTAPVFFVRAQDKFGNRWAHHAAFPGTRKEYDDEGLPRFIRIDDAEARAERLCARIAARGTIDLQHWAETFPEYGSEAYAEQDQLGVHKQWERDRECA